MIGRPVRRREDRDLLLGGAAFLDDRVAPEALDLVFARSTHAHATRTPSSRGLTCATRRGCPVAQDRYLAEDAAERIEVGYVPLEVVSSIEGALDPRLPALHEGDGEGEGNVIFAERMTTGTSRPGRAVPRRGRPPGALQFAEHVEAILEHPDPPRREALALQPGVDRLSGLSLLVGRALDVGQVQRKVDYVLLGDPLEPACAAD